MNMHERLGTDHSMNYDTPDVFGWIRRHRVTIGIATLLTGATAGLIVLDQQDHARVQRIEACVEDRVGHDVELHTNPENGRIMKPAVLLDDIVVCQQGE